LGDKRLIEARLEHFPVGMEFDVETEAGSQRLVVDKAEPFKTLVREGGAFTVLFRGPPQPVLPQGLYALKNGEEVREIFIVPIASLPDGARYEAVFN
jgi:hypothetical protein